MSDAVIFAAVRKIVRRHSKNPLEPLVQLDVDELNAALQEARTAPKPSEGPQTAEKPETSPSGLPAPPAGLSDPAPFFASVRKQFGALNEKQVEGFNAILSACAAAGWGIAYTADALATAWLETNKTMQPVREAYWVSEEWRRKNLRYYPHYGRGYVQLTWDYNYKTADDKLDLGGSLVANLDRALEPEIAAKIMVRGMEEGWFTRKKLADYLPAKGPATSDQFKQSRRIINGIDRWDDLAEFAMKFQAALQAGGMA
jgi:putative chitinase